MDPSFVEDTAKQPVYEASKQNEASTQLTTVSISNQPHFPSESLSMSLINLSFDMLCCIVNFLESMEDVICLGFTTLVLYNRIGLYLHFHFVKNQGNPTQDFFLSNGWGWVTNYYDGSWRTTISRQQRKLRKSVLSILGTSFLKHLDDHFSNMLIPYGEILLLASEHGNIELVQFVIYNNTIGIFGIDQDNQAIRIASKNGHADIVNLLLTWKGVDPSVEDNIALRVACESGYLNIVKSLLSTGRVDPTSQDNTPFRIACKNGHLEVAKLLLETGVIDPTAQYNYAIRFASQSGRLDIVKMLLTIDGVNPADGDSYALTHACKNGHLEVVKLLINHPCVDPTANNNIAIRFASRFGHAKVVELLLTCNRGVKPTKDALQWAIKNRHTEVQNILKLYEN